MSKFKIDFNKSLIKVLIVYAAIFVAGIIVTCIFGVNLDINFRGGTRISYSYTGDIADSDIEASLEDIIDGSFKVDKSTSLAGDTKTFSVSLIGSKSLSAEVQENMLSALQEDFKDNEVDIYDSNSVSPTIAGTFFAFERIGSQT